MRKHNRFLPMLLAALTAAGVLYRDTLEKEWSELTEKVGAFLEGCKNG